MRDSGAEVETEEPGGGEDEAGVGFFGVVEFGEAGAAVCGVVSACTGD